MFAWGWRILCTAACPVLFYNSRRKQGKQPQDGALHAKCLIPHYLYSFSATGRLLTITPICILFFPTFFIGFCRWVQLRKTCMKSKVAIPKLRVWQTDQNVAFWLRHQLALASWWQGAPVGQGVMSAGTDNSLIPLPLVCAGLGAVFWFRCSESFHLCYFLTEWPHLCFLPLFVSVKNVAKWHPEMWQKKFKTFYIVRSVNTLTQ